MSGCSEPPSEASFFSCSDMQCMPRDKRTQPNLNVTNYRLRFKRKIVLPLVQRYKYTFINQLDITKLFLRHIEFTAWLDGKSFPAASAVGTLTGT